MEKIKNHYKDLEHFKTSVTIARNHFNGGEYINVIFPRYTHPEGITRARAKTLYEEEMISRKKNNSDVGQIKTSVTRVFKVDYANDYQTILEVMDMLGIDYIDENYLEYVLRHAEIFYNTYFEQQSENEEEKGK